MAPTTTAATLSEEIDQLLEHYLDLLDQYTTLRSQLSSLQSSVSSLHFPTDQPINKYQVYQHISRANFSAERGIRYGADFYDARMQATRVCHITVPASDTTTTGAQGGNVVEGQTLDNVERDTAATATSTDAEGLKEKERQATAATGMETACFTISTAHNDSADEHAAANEKGESRRMRKDPLRMFGLLTPPTLREAQRESVTMVEEILPKLVSVDAEMKEVEIRIRRARKWKSKAEVKEGNVTEKEIYWAEPRQELVV